MADFDLGSATTTDFTNTVDNFSVDSVTLDRPNAGPGGETYWYFTEAAQNYGYLKTIPELAGGVDLLGIWTAGKGYVTNALTTVELEHISGWGEDTFQSIMQGMIVTKKIVGDAFCEVVWGEGSTLLNLMPVSPQRVRIVLNPNGRIKRYDISKNGKWVGVSKEKMFHICNNRVADEIHGNSMMNVCKWTLDALQEAYEDKRIMSHRSKALGIVYYKTSNTGKITYANEQIEKAVNKGEMLGLPEDTAKIESFPAKNTGDLIEWIRHLENRIYIAMKVPRVMATSEGYTEAGSKSGFVTFEPIYVAEQTLLEADLWNQLGIKIKFNKPPSLSGVMKEDEEKNTGQVGFQPNETQVGVGE